MGLLKCVTLHKLAEGETVNMQRDGYRYESVTRWNLVTAVVPIYCFFLQNFIITCTYTVLR